LQISKIRSAALLALHVNMVTDELATTDFERVCFPFETNESGWHLTRT